MKLVLTSNILEHSGFPEFVQFISAHHRDSIIAVTGDLLNIFPEPGEDVKGSICYELFGEIIEDGLNELIKTRFKDVSISPLVPILKDVFYPAGTCFQKAQTIAQLRYQRLFRKLDRSFRFSPHENTQFLYIPGNMDYPFEAALAISHHKKITQLDCTILEINGVKIGGIGGIPNSTHPFQGVVEISPYEMHPMEYARRLQMLVGVDILLTHLSPKESKEIDEFLRSSPVKMLICRAPFDFNRQSNFRGQLEVIYHYGKPVIMVRPFDFPMNNYLMVELPSLAITTDAWISKHKSAYEIATPRSAPIQ